jgi:hypothetical protein
MSLSSQQKAMVFFGILSMTAACSGRDNPGDSNYVESKSSRPAADSGKNADAKQPAEKKEEVATEEQQTESTETVEQEEQADTTPEAVDTTPDLSKYAGYVEPSQAEIENPRNIVLYNYLQDEGIATFNGRKLKQVVPPGKSAVIPKLFVDLSQLTNRYMVNVRTDSGKSGSGQFNAMSVNAAGWKASVSLNDAGSGLAVDQVAGGGGDGGAFNLDNFQ